MAAWLDGEQGGKGAGEKGSAPLRPGLPSPLLSRMMALSVAYQQERPNVEAADVTGLVIRALGLILGKLIRDEGDRGDQGDRGELTNKRYFLLTATITQASQGLAEVLEQDIHPDDVTSRKIGSVLRKIRLPSSRQPKTGKKGWIVSLSDVIRWAQSYGLEPSTITGLKLNTHSTKFTPVTSVTPNKSTLVEGIL